MNESTAVKNTPVETLSFEEGLSELEGIVRDLESGNAPLEQAISYYERGTALKKHCEGKLREAQAKIEKISMNEDGSISKTPFDTEE